MVNKNTVKEAIGKTKSALGRATGDKRLESRGAAESVAGKVQKGVGKATTKVKSALS